jgi:hypothetical protein
MDNGTIRDDTIVNSKNAILCETFTIASCNTLNITNIDIKKIRKNPANKKSDFVVSGNDENMYSARI